MAIDEERNVQINDVDLTNCDREPIHIPGSIQPQGVLLAFTPGDLTLVQVSKNVQDFLGFGSGEVLQQSLAKVLGPASLEILQAALQLEDLSQANPLDLVVSTPTGEKHFTGVLHRQNGLFILELERPEHTQEISFFHFHNLIRASSSVFQGAADLRSLSQATADLVRRLTGFDRVMIYKFHPDWHGEVIAEARREDLEPYLGLHYPASDIPSQARELYHRNWLRLIADVSYQPVPLTPLNNPLTGQPLDLSFSVLRSVSPMHIAYLKNMQVAASMSISLIHEGELWGLISCHHGSPRTLPYTIRTACEFLGQLFALQITARADFETYAHEMQVKNIQTRLIAHLLEREDVLISLNEKQDELLALAGAQGAALYLAGKYTPFGDAPAEEDVLPLLDWLQDHLNDDVLVTDSLPALYPAGEYLKAQASGLLAASLSHLEGSYVLWFRPEVVRVVQWGGNPEKPMELEGDIPVLHPRTSFAAWSQTVRLKSQPWQSYEIEAARALRSAIIDRLLRTIVAQRADELAQMNVLLEKSNDELASFAYTVSHDLKEPLRGIYNYVQILQEDYAGQLDPGGRERLQTLSYLSQRLGGLIDALLHYSRVGQIEFSFAAIDLDEVLQRTLRILQPQIQESAVEIRVPRPLPTLYCDRARVGEIFSNLITNAIKYNDKKEQWIEIGFNSPDADASEGRFVFYVRDNGIGIQEKHFETIFHIFKRLYGREKFGGGSGAGLTIVKRIVERHGGKIWVESTYGEGTTFFFTLQKESEA